ncbi:hypothetical protein RRG08_042860 [Elysia crispata]|uniref:G-protein coupled receptors family 1 profile domain-containing protein n=1 Tax=Elysia crispata TaxID=231223 RepID=A0AAE1AJ24_9GAST|nr:hypothetical protein RRG08_042860 [Elysia crispata]
MKNNTANTEIISLNTTWAGNTSCHDTSSQDDSHQTPAILAMPWLSYAMLCVAAFLGIPGNILVIAIYAKIGFSEFDLQYDGERNQTLLRVSFANTSGADNLFNAAFLYRSVVLNFVPLVFTLVCSITLSVHMRKNALWRLRTTSQATGQGETNSSADLLARRKYASDMRVSKIVLTLAAASSVLGFLYALRSLLAVLLPGFKPVEIYGDEYKLISRQLLFLSEINSSVNVIIYYNMGSKFRQTFRRLFRLKNKNNT